MPGRIKTRGLVYLRRSTEKQEISLGAQLEWAIAQAGKLSVILDAAPGDLVEMQSRRLHSLKDIRLDDGITGADLKRPGFTALNSDALNDRSISHMFVYRRDRFARPEDAIDMVALEKRLLTAGITLVFYEGIAEPC